MSTLYNPVSTYRIQFNSEFTLKDMEEHIEYLSLLGICTVYASPVFTATPGSGHGYDTTDPLKFNPEITTLEEFRRISGMLAEKKIGWMQDIVSNHMALHPDNKWMMDVLEKGHDSHFHMVFDLEPGVPSQQNRMMIPFLGETTEDALENNNIKLGWKNGNFTLEYFDNVYPVNFETFRDILAGEMQDAPRDFQELGRKNMFDNQNPDKVFRNSIREESKQQIQELEKTNQALDQFIQKILQKFNSSKDLLKEILDKQYYELCHWQETEKRINYRRFFTVNGLICLRMEDEKVFELYHSLIKQMIDEGLFHGLRVDHVDGLKDPNVYLNRLRILSGPDVYIVVEKILEYEEDMPEFWPVQGNTGYDFLATVNNVLTSTKNYNKLRGLYREVTSVTDSPAELIYQNKKLILRTQFHGEWDNLFRYFNELGFVDYETENVGQEEIKEAIGEFMLACPVYRLYPRRFPLQFQNRETVEEIFEIALKRNPSLKTGLDTLAKILLATEETYQEYNGKPEMFFSRLMQFTGPLMAKGVEDTSMYQYNAFIAHNEVGDAINARGITNEEYHRQMLGRHTDWPMSMSTTSTHDTKRGEDVRARLNVISVLTDEWEENVQQWMQMNQKLKVRLESGLLEPSHSVEYFIYQTILGTFPFDGQADETYMKRIDEYLVKALREAKRKVSWSDPDETYESTVCEFARKMLDPEHEFMESFRPFMQKVAWRGVVNSISQLALKCLSPGIPDIYQGTELWDLTLVDPDNRQPVDYELRKELLQELITENEKDPLKLMRELLSAPFDGRIKLWLTYVLLKERRNDPELFVKGEYIPLEVKGKLKGHVLAFARRLNDSWLVTAVPLLTDDLSPRSEGEFIQDISWDDTRLSFAQGAPQKLKNILTGKESESGDELQLGELFHETTIVLLSTIS